MKFYKILTLDQKDFSVQITARNGIVQEVGYMGNPVATDSEHDVICSLAQRLMDISLCHECGGETDELVSGDRLCNCCWKKTKPVGDNK